ncbi:MAG: DUF1538 domain-containing protein [Rhodospirillales bacterium]|nr:DUF1538 domain-containing protein [Rhodospirillales bacterium]
MTEFIAHLISVTGSTVLDVLPIALILFFFQAVVLRKKPAHLKRILIGFFYVLIGLSLFLVGLEEALFPLGNAMAEMLTNPVFLGIEPTDPVRWQDYMWVYLFAASIGFATTIAEPSLIAVSIKAQEVSGGALKAFELRIAVAIGVAFGVSLGAYRIVSGTPLPLYIMAGYTVVIAQTFFATKSIIPLAYDSGGVTTSTVTVPVVAALGLGLASAIPGRSPLLDGFGLIAFASVFPIVSVLGYDMLIRMLRGRKEQTRQEKIL